MPQFENVSITKQANVYFDGRCISYSLQFADGTKKTVGVILPGSVLNFNTAAAEIMECVAGSCRVRRKGEHEWQTYAAGQSFSVPENSAFEIEAEAAEPCHYVCHFA
ncbi:MAG: pyrimidine/purine nucleoside phosphorylase [Sterolibacterium sp.]|nr:pyrimidine/purine nucleoside phosphorylase [Sterolibacterium sp.]